jgi:hypothetical protein
MSDDANTLTGQRLKTPRTAAGAGILFGVLLITANVLIRLSIPPNPADAGVWLEEQANTVALALSLVPIAGIAFLWFIGVVRDRMGQLEDRFFSSVFFGSGLLYLGMTFVAAGLAAGLLTSYALEADKLMASGVYTYSRAVMYRITNVYAVRMAGVFMISLGTISVRTRILHRGLALLTYGLALFLLVSISLSVWVSLIFPSWVLIVSIYILVLNLRSRGAGVEGDLSSVVE